MNITWENKDLIKEIFKSYWIKNKSDIFEVSFDEKALLKEILKKFPKIEYENEWGELDKLWDIYYQIDKIECDDMLWKNKKVNFVI